MKVFLYRGVQGFYYVIGPNENAVKRDCEMVSLLVYERSIPHDLVRENMGEIPVILDGITYGTYYRPISEMVEHEFPYDPCEFCTTRICGKPKKEIKNGKRREGTSGK